MVFNSCLCLDNCARIAKWPHLAALHCIPRYKFSVFSCTNPIFTPTFFYNFHCSVAENNIGKWQIGQWGEKALTRHSVCAASMCWQ